MERIFSSILIAVLVIICILMFTGNCYATIIRVGESYTVHAKFKHVLKEDLEVVWFDNDETVSQCSLKGGCLEDFQGETVTTLTFDPQTGFASCDVTILRVTSQKVGTWKLNYLGTAGLVHPESLFSCTLNNSVTPDSINSTCDAIPSSNSNVIAYVTILLAIVIVTVAMTYLCIKFFKFDKYVQIEKCKMYWIVNGRGSKSCKEREICKDKHIAVESLLIQKV